jgi:hypothetical protein
MTNKSKKTRTKSAKESPKMPSLVVQPNGRGAIYSGGVPGNAGGGRPKDIVRDKLANLAEGKGFRFLDELMEGKVRFRLVGKCGECGHEGEPNTTAEADALWDEIKASIDHRLKANDQILRYGVGTKDEVMTPASAEVQARLQATVNLISAKAPQLLDELEAVWK